MYFPTTRVLTVLELLQSRSKMSGPELAERLEVDTRTVRRYITMLQDLGIPVEAERGRYGSYRLRPGFKLPPLMFTDDEALALSLGLLAARKIGLGGAAPAVEGALAKIERVLPLTLRERVQGLQETLIFDMATSSTPPRSEIVSVLSTAAQQERIVELYYRSYNGEITERAFDPYGLVYRSGFWYTVAIAICERTCVHFAWIVFRTWSCVARHSLALKILIAWSTSYARFPTHLPRGSSMYC